MSSPKYAALFAVLASLVSCAPEKSRIVDACRSEADRFFQGYQTDDVNNPRSRYIIECMASKGYLFEISSTDCDSRRSLPTQPACYSAATWLGRFLDTIVGD